MLVWTTEGELRSSPIPSHNAHALHFARTHHYEHVAHVVLRLELVLPHPLVEVAVVDALCQVLHTTDTYVL